MSRTGMMLAWTLVALLLSWGPPAAAQPTEPAPSAPPEETPSAPPTETPSAPPEETPSAPPEETPSAPAPEPPAEGTEGSPAEPPAEPPAEGTPPPAPAKRRAPQGALVVAETAAAQRDAKVLARVIYADQLLRPAISEAMAQVLVGAPPAEGDAAQKEAASLVQTVMTLQDDTVRRRLLASLASDLGAQLVVVVRPGSDGATARVLRMPDERFVNVTLAADPKAAEPWRDSVGILRGLVAGPPPGPRSKPAGGTVAKPPEDDDGDWDLLTSPWFWGGLGVVVTVGVTVLVLSQTALNEPDVVMLEGRIGP